MNKLFTIVILMCGVMLGAGKSQNRMLLIKAAEEIKIDGVIEPAWMNADSVVNFFQLDPFYGQEPSQKTVAKLMASDDALYCLMICYDNTGQVQVNSGTHDQFTGDIVSIMLDTYNDQRTAYKFAVSASGVKSDCRMVDDGRNRDYSWDGVWFAESRTYPWGFAVEMQIPFKSISYDKNLNEWGIDFDRWIPHSNEDIYWNRYEKNEGLRISKFGKLVFGDVRPVTKGMNLEIYPVGLVNSSMLKSGKYDVRPDAGLDVFYNPSPSLTYQLTVNPDFAQIEADPYDFNISRYESYFSERRPFFTQGNEVFTASGKERGSGFYSPLELFYSRRIGKKLPDGSEVPFIAGTKAFGRIGEWEYGGALSMTGEKEYITDGEKKKEDRAYFGVARLKKQILGNSTLGFLFVGKNTPSGTSGVMDIDGAFRQSAWQLAWQLARSFKDNSGDIAASAGFRFNNSRLILLSRFRHVGNNFDVSDVGYVPWKGTTNNTTLGGPIWYFDKSYVKNMMIYMGGSFNYEKVDLYTDHYAVLGLNMQLRDNWGYEINYSYGKSRDAGVNYTGDELSLSSWYNISPKWNANLWGNYSRTYNFDRSYQGTYLNAGNYFEYKISRNLTLGNDFNAWIELKPDKSVEEVTYNARPFINVIPVNNLTLRLYVDNVVQRSTGKLERIIAGFLFSYNFLPKSWIYFAYNEVQNRTEDTDPASGITRMKLKPTDRASVMKIKYLYYF